MPTPTSSSSHVVIDPPLDIGTSTTQAIQDRFTLADAEFVARRSENGTLASLTTTVKTSLVAAINELVTLYTAITANNWVTTARIAANAVTTGKLAAGAVDATALAVDAVTTTRILDANVTTNKLANGAVTTGKLAGAAVTSTEIAAGGVLAGNIASDAVTTAKILNANVTGAKIATDAIAPASIVWDVFNKTVPVGTDFLGRPRWAGITNLSIIDAVTGASPFGTPVLRFAAGGSISGKYIYAAELGLQTGDIVRFAMLVKAASSTVSINARCFDSSGGTLGSVVTATVSPAGAITYVATGDVTVVATTNYIEVWVSHGAAVLADIYALWGARGQYIGLYPPGSDGYPDVMAGTNIVWDTFGHEYVPGIDFGGRSRWHQPTGYSSILYPDATNPFNSSTLIIDATASQPGKNIYLRDGGLQVGDWVGFSMMVASPGGTSVLLRCGFWTAAGVLISSVLSPGGALSSTLTTRSTPLAQIPATTDFIKLTTERSGTAATASLYALWGGRGGATAVPTPSPLTANLIAGEAARNLATVDRAGLQQWRSKASPILRSVASTKAIINLFGDSWFQKDTIVDPLRDYLISLYGDAGSGYIGIVFGDQYQYNWTAVRTGTWAEIDIDASATAKGPDGTHATTTDTSATWVVTATVTDFKLHYRTVTGGGSFGWKIDAGSVTTVSTDAAASYQTLSIPAGALGSHALTITIPVAGAQGVLLCGVEALKNQNGVRVNKLGNGSSDSAKHTATVAADVQAAFTALGGDINFILLGTNDRVHSMSPGTYEGNLLTMVDRLQIALPLADNVILFPGDTNQPGTPFISSAYEAAARHACVLRPRVSFLSIYASMSPFADADSRGLMTDALHMGTNGGYVIADLISDFLRVR